MPPSWPTDCAASASPATSGSRPSSGTTSSTSRPISRCRRWVRCSTPSTSGSSRSSWSTSPTTPRTGSSSSTTRWCRCWRAQLPHLETVHPRAGRRAGRRLGRPRRAARLRQGGPALRGPARRGSPRSSSGPRWTSATRRRCATPAAPPGNPKGVVYSHRSAWLHSLAVSTGNVSGIDSHDRVLPIVPMFHANAWGLAYAALMNGASLCMPDRWLQAEPMVRFIQASRPTMSGAVPTVWNDVLQLPRRAPGREARLPQVHPVRRLRGTRSRCRRRCRSATASTSGRPGA